MGNKLDRLFKNSILIWDLQTVGYSLSQLNPKRFNEFPSHDEICNVGGIQSAWPLEVKITFALNFGSKPSDSLLMSIISGVQTLSAVTTIWSIPPCISGFHIIKSSCQVYLSVKAYQHDFEFAKMNHYSWVIRSYLDASIVFLTEYEFKSMHWAKFVLSLIVTLALAVLNFPSDS